MAIPKRQTYGLGARVCRNPREFDRLSPRRRWGTVVGEPVCRGRGHWYLPVCWDDRPERVFQVYVQRLQRPDGP